MHHADVNGVFHSARVVHVHAVFKFVAFESIIGVFGIENVVAETIFGAADAHGDYWRPEAKGSKVCGDFFWGELLGFFALFFVLALLVLCIENIVTFFAESCASETVCAAEAVIAVGAVCTVFAVLQVVAVVTVFGVYAVVAKFAFVRVAQVGAVAVPARIESVHAVLKTVAVETDVCVFAFVELVAVIAVCAHVIVGREVGGRVDEDFVLGGEVFHKFVDFCRLARPSFGRALQVRGG